MTELESTLRTRLAEMADTVAVDHAWEESLLVGVGVGSSRPRPRLPSLLLAVAAASTLVAAFIAWWGPSRQEPAAPDRAAQLPSWAPAVIAELSAAVPQPERRSGAGTIRFDGRHTTLVASGGAAVEITGLDPADRPPQWTPESTLLLMRPRTGCPIVAELHPFGAVEPLLRRCDAVALSPDGTTLLLGRLDGSGTPLTATGTLDLGTGQETLWAAPIELGP